MELLVFFIHLLRPKCRTPYHYMVGTCFLETECQDSLGAQVTVPVVFIPSPFVPIMPYFFFSTKCFRCRVSRSVIVNVGKEQGTETQRCELENILKNQTIYTVISILYTVSHRYTKLFHGMRKQESQNNRNMDLLDYPLTFHHSFVWLCW